MAEHINHPYFASHRSVTLHLVMLSTISMNGRRFHVKRNMSSCTALYNLTLIRHDAQFYWVFNTLKHCLFLLLGYTNYCMKHHINTSDIPFSLFFFLFHSLSQSLSVTVSGLKNITRIQTPQSDGCGSAAHFCTCPLSLAGIFAI